MKPKFAFYTQADFGRVYHFLKAKESNDLIAYERVRFQFAVGLHIDFIDNGLQNGFERTCGIWEDDLGIVSLVMTEGGTRFGETFFIFRCEEVKTVELLERMCDFAERFTSKVSEDCSSNSYRLCVPKDDAVLCEFISARGYNKTDSLYRILAKSYSDEKEKSFCPTDSLFATHG
jgi:hypothetical protein